MWGHTLSFIPMMFAYASSCPSQLNSSLSPKFRFCSDKAFRGGGGGDGGGHRGCTHNLPVLQMRKLRHETFAQVVRGRWRICTRGANFRIHMLRQGLGW